MWTYIFQYTIHFLKVLKFSDQTLVGLQNNSNNAVWEGKAAVHCSWAWVLAAHACPVKVVKNVRHDRVVCLVNILMFRTRKVQKKINYFFYMHTDTTEV